MSAGAWIFMVSAWTVILSYTGYCFYKLLTSTRRFGEHPDDENSAG